jgi:hypothetical protein
MSPASRPSVSLFAALFLLGSATGAAALELDGLVKNSPFGQATERAIGEAKPGTLEFRGMYVDNGVTYFSVYNSITKQSAWIAEGEVPTNLPVTIKGYDAASETLIVENAGQPVKLPMRVAVISATAAAPAPVAPAPVAAAPAPAAGAPQFGGFGNGQQPTPEQIQAFRDEMRKRWGERQQGGNAEGGAPQFDRMSRGRGGEGATTNAVPTKGDRPTKGAR